jgi:hypothetical protein
MRFYCTSVPSLWKRTPSNNNEHWSEGSLLGSKTSSITFPLVAHYGNVTRFPTAVAFHIWDISPTCTWTTAEPAEPTQNIVTYISDYWRGLNLFHLYTQLLTTSNSLSRIYTHTGFSVFTSRILATDL